MVVATTLNVNVFFNALYIVNEYSRAPRCPENQEVETREVRRLPFRLISEGRTPYNDLASSYEPSTFGKDLFNKFAPSFFRPDKFASWKKERTTGGLRSTVYGLRTTANGLRTTANLELYNLRTL